jgi:hypothetical protein
MYKKSFVLGSCLGFLLLTAGFGTAAGGDARLVDAVMRADREAVRSLLQQKIDINAAQADGTTALHWAVRKNDLETAQLLIRAGAKVDASTRYGVTPLYFAAENGNAAIIDALLKAGVDANSANPGGETALMTAARTGKMDAVKLLLDRGAKVNIKESTRGQTALMWAVLENHADVVKLLLANGADINGQTDIVIPDGITDTPQATSGDIGAHGPGIYRSRAVPSPSGAMTPSYSRHETAIWIWRGSRRRKADLERLLRTAPAVGGRDCEQSHRTRDVFAGKRRRPERGGSLL